MAQLNFNIEDICGTLSENKDGWRKELTYISWNNRAPKFNLARGYRIPGHDQRYYHDQGRTGKTA